MPFSAICQSIRSSISNDKNIRLPDLSPLLKDQHTSLQSSRLCTGSRFKSASATKFSFWCIRLSRARTNIHPEPVTSSCTTQAAQIIVHQTSKHSKHTPFMGSPLLLTLWPITTYGMNSDKSLHIPASKPIWTLILLNYILCNLASASLLRQECLLRQTWRIINCHYYYYYLCRFWCTTWAIDVLLYINWREHQLNHQALCRWLPPVSWNQHNEGYQGSTRRSQKAAQLD